MSYFNFFPETSKVFIPPKNVNIKIDTNTITLEIKSFDQMTEYLIPCFNQTGIEIECNCNFDYDIFKGLFGTQEDYEINMGNQLRFCGIKNNYLVFLKHGKTLYNIKILYGDKDFYDEVVS
jgi:hypothetical protein